MITYTYKGPWLNDAIEEAGHWLLRKDGVWISSDDVAVQAIIDSFDPLPFAQAEKIAAIKVEAGERGKDIYSFLSTDPEKANDFYKFANDIIEVIHPGSRQSIPQDLLDFKAIRDAAVAAIATVNAETDWTVVMAYDVVNTPAWP